VKGRLVLLLNAWQNVSPAAELTRKHDDAACEQVGSDLLD
jgi:hypothetical protein